MRIERSGERENEAAPRAATEAGPRSEAEWGTLVQHGHGAGVPGAQVHAFPLDADFGDGAITGPGGQYRIEGLPSGHYRMEVNVPGYETLVYYPRTFEEGDALPVQVTAPMETSGIDIIVPEPMH